MRLNMRKKLIVVLNPEVDIIIPEFVIIKFNKLQTSQIRVGGSQGSKTWFLSPHESILSVSLLKKMLSNQTLFFALSRSVFAFIGENKDQSATISALPQNFPPPPCFSCVRALKVSKKTQKEPHFLLLTEEGECQGTRALTARQRAYQRHRERERGGAREREN